MSNSSRRAVIRKGPSDVQTPTAPVPVMNGRLQWEPLEKGLSRVTLAPGTPADEPMPRSF